ncbi:F-box only protein 15 isoform X2 [Hyperolius riggenbachi]
MSVGCVSKQFYELSKDNVLWYKIYAIKTHVRWKCDSADTLGERLAETTIKEKDPGYWKKTFISKLISESERRINQLMKVAKRSNMYGMPADMQKAVKMSGLTWALTLKNVNGKETVIDQHDVTFRDTSLTVSWKCYVWPAFRSLATLQIHGVRLVQADESLCPTKSGFRRFSLVAEYNVKDFHDTGRYIGEDNLVKLFYFEPGLALGVWKKTPDIAFAMATLHYHQLLEKSLSGTANSPYVSPVHAPVLDDIDPHYGLHGYRLHLHMYSGPRTYLRNTYRNLFSGKNYIRGGDLKLTAVSFKNNREHEQLVGKVNLAWENFTFNGRIQDCFMMDVTLLDESDSPYWCFSAPVKLHERQQSEVSYDFMGQSFYLEHKDSVGKVYAQLNWMNETKEYFLINLVLYLSIEKLNNYFGTSYTDAPQ